MLFAGYLPCSKVPLFEVHVPGFEARLQWALADYGLAAESQLHMFVSQTADASQRMSCQGGAALGGVIIEFMPTCRGRKGN
jgi:hypothetical protein